MEASWVVQPLGVAATGTSVAHSAHHGGLVVLTLGLLWVLGALAVAVPSFVRWMSVRRILRETTPTSLNFVIPVRSSAAQLEPAVAGILHPVLLLPKGIEQRLTAEHMRAVLAHERAHVAWRDNLAAALHMLIETLFWFHPLVWWLGKRLVEERERACDEQVLAEGHRPEHYAEAILRVCELYLQSSLTCIAGVGGGGLPQRIEAIMNNRRIERMNVIQKLVICGAASAAIVLPVAAGALVAPHPYAQQDASNPQGPNSLPPSNAVAMNLTGGGERANSGAAAASLAVQGIEPSSSPPTSRAQVVKLKGRARITQGNRALAGDLTLMRRSGAGPKDSNALKQPTDSGVLAVPSNLIAADTRPSSDADSPVAEPSAPSTTAVLPRKIRDAPAQFPMKAIQQNIEGSVTVQFVIDVTGKPREVRVVESTPPGIFDRAAIQAVERWRYEPMLAGVAPTEVPMSQTILFRYPAR